MKSSVVGVGAFQQDRVRTEIKGWSAQTCSCSRDSICGRVSENHWVFRTACFCVPSLPAGDEETKKARKSPTVGWQWVLSGFSSGQVSIPNQVSAEVPNQVSAEMLHGEVLCGEGI